MSYGLEVQGQPISRLPSTLGEFGETCRFGWDYLPCQARNAARAAQKLADEAMDKVDEATGGAWSATRKDREGAAQAISQTTSNVGRTVSQAAQATSQTIQSFSPPPPSAAQKRDFNRNPVLYVVNQVTAPAAGWFVELMLRLAQRTGRKSLSKTLLNGQRVNIDLVPKPSDSLIQTSLKLVAWLQCCTFGFNEEVARKMFGFPVGKKGFFGSYDFKVPGVGISRLPSGPSGAAFRFGESDFWTDGIGPTGVEETAAVAAEGLKLETLILGLSEVIISGLVGLMVAKSQGAQKEVTPASVGNAALAAQLNAAMAALPDSDFDAGSGSQDRPPETDDNFLPIAVGGAVGVGMLLLLLFKTKKK